MTELSSTQETQADDLPAGLTTAQDEVVDLCRTLLRFDTSNPTRDEMEAAQWMSAQLEEAGLSAELIESEPGRANVVCRLAGSVTERDALLLHAPLDVVPADPYAWIHPRIEGVIEH